jgi:TolB-like protein
MIDRDAAMPDERRIRFRIGINLGDVIAEGDDIFGDGVNVAARLEALAEPGGICVSGTVHDHIRDRLPYPLDDLGEQSVKNITRPVRVYALRPEAVAALPSASAPPAASIAQPAVTPRLSIVVLPFANLSDDPEQQYFADGITEDLTTDLSRIEGSFVISRNTATDEAVIWLEKARNAIPSHPLPHAILASAYALNGDADRAAAELAEARRLVADDRYSSIARLKAVGSYGVPKIRALFEATYFAGLRKAGMPEE